MLRGGCHEWVSAPARTSILRRLGPHKQARRLAACLLLVSFSLLAACSDTTEPPPPPPDGNLGALQITIEGLPNGVDAQVEVTGPEDYSSTVTGSQTLELRPGSYSVEVITVTYQGVSYTGLIAEIGSAETAVDVLRGETVSLGVSYTSVGSVDEDEIAPGVTRSDVVAENAFDDYTFQGVENVPLIFDFTGTEGEFQARYGIAIYEAGALDEPLYESLPFGSSGIQPLFGFAPPGSGTYVFRVRGLGKIVDYQVTATYLNGSPETRSSPTLLAYDEAVQGAVTEGSYDSYRFTGTFNEPALFSFSLDTSDARYRGVYQVEVYRVGQTDGEPLTTEGPFNNFSGSPEFAFTPPEDGDYLVRVVGLSSTPSREGRSLIRYRLELARLE